MLLTVPRGLVHRRSSGKVETTRNKEERVYSAISRSGSTFNLNLPGKLVHFTANNQVSSRNQVSVTSSQMFETDIANENALDTTDKGMQCDFPKPSDPTESTNPYQPCEVTYDMKDIFIKHNGISPAYAPGSTKLMTALARQQRPRMFKPILSTKSN